jgi:hypothetical protein
MIFKRKPKNDHKVKLAEAIAHTRKAVQCGLSIDKLFRREIEEKFDCIVPVTLTCPEFIANQAGLDVEVLNQAVLDIVDGENPAKYRWLGVKNNLPAFYGLVSCLFVLQENEAQGN